MKNSILFFATSSLLAVASYAQDQGSDSIALIQASDLQGGKIIPADVRVISSGQPDAAMFEALADAGFSIVVDFRAADEDRGLDEQKVVEQLGMVYATVPISGAADISFANAAVLNEILANNEGRILLHCGSANRVGALVALREKLLGASNDDALAAGKTAGLTRLEKVVTGRLAEK